MIQPLENSPRPVVAQPQYKVGVLLNGNAKKVTPRVKERIEEACEGYDLHFSRSLEEGQEIARRLLEADSRLVITGGGDGTISKTINFLFQHTGRQPGKPSFRRDYQNLHALRGTTRPLPPIAILKLGTGNAMAELVGSGRLEQDLARIRRATEDGRELPTMRLPLVQAEGEVFPFGGLGWDAAVLNDYGRLKDSCKSNLSKAVFNTVFGYFVAALGMTVPRILTSRPPEVEVRTLGEACLLGDDGRPERLFQRGALLYRGPMNLLSFSTIPYYGYGFKVFPFTEGLTDRFQMRLSTAGVAEVLGHMPSLWKGQYRTPRILDFHCERVTCTFSRPVPYQVAGDPRGLRETLTVGASDYPVDLVDFRTIVQPRYSRVPLKPALEG